MRIKDLISEDDEKQKSRTASNHSFIKKFSREKYNMPEPLEIVDDPEEVKSLHKQLDTTMVDPGDDIIDQLNNAGMKRELTKILMTLSPRYERIARMRFMDQKGPQEIANELGISVSRVSQIENKLIRMLRGNPKIQYLGQILGLSKADLWARRANWSIEDYIKYYGEKPNDRWISTRGLDKNWSIEDYEKYYGKKPDWYWINERNLDKDWTIKDYKKYYGYLPDLGWISRKGFDNGWDWEDIRNYRKKVWASRRRAGLAS